jgi:hypothetical protein
MLATISNRGRSRPQFSKQMKITKKPSPWIAKVTCNGDHMLKTVGCSVEVEITESDLKLFHFFGTHFKHEYLSVRCPHCGLIIQKIKVPEPVFRHWKLEHPKEESEFDGFDDRV